MTRAVLALLAVLLSVGPAAAQQLGRRQPEWYLGTKSAAACSLVRLSATDLPQTTTAGQCTVSIGNQFPPIGSCVGDPADTGAGNDFCDSGVDFGNRKVDFDTSDQFKMKLYSSAVSGTCTPTGILSSDCTSSGSANKCYANLCTDYTDGTVGWNDNAKMPVFGISGTAAVGANDITLHGGDGTGGTGLAGTAVNFVYGGEDATNADASKKCAAHGGTNPDVCRGGTCSGTHPNGTCSLTANTNIFQVNSTNAAAKGFYAQWNNMTITAGTVTTNATSEATVTIRLRGSFRMTGGSINLQGLGGPAGAGGATTTCSGSTDRVGGNSAQTFLFGAAAGGATTNSPGTAGTSMSAYVGTFLHLALITRQIAGVGTGGGGGAGAGAVGANAGAAIGGVSAVFAPTLFGGGTGGGGGAADCAGATGAGGAGGTGGGALHLEIGDTFECTTATSPAINVKGNNGTNGACAGGGGGGGGSVLIFARKFSSNNSCTMTAATLAAGGTAGTAGHANCGAGGAGGTGHVLQQVTPF